MPDWLIATILGIVEGLTEFVSVSPTGHLIVAGELLGWNASIKDMFEVIIQVGAIIAILVVYQERFRSRVMLDHSLGTGDTRRLSIGPGAGFRGLSGWILLICSTVPAAILGFLFLDVITRYLFNLGTVAIGRIVSGVALIVVEPVLPSVQPSVPNQVAIPHDAPAPERRTHQSPQTPTGRVEPPISRSTTLTGKWPC